MRLLKKVVFWLHLVAGLSAGLVILVMAVTGVVMTYERQILEATTGVSVKPAGEALGPEAILAKFADAEPAASGISFRNDPEEPAVVMFGRGKSVFVNPYTGESLGEGNVGLKKFFAWNLTLHRWLAQEGGSRDTGKAVTGAANLVFLFLVVSGLWLWFPKRWTRTAFRAVTTVRRGLKGRARDWNWHNAFGFWACIPLFFMVLTGAVMSYPWASGLIFKAVGETPPPPRMRGGAPGGERTAAGGERRGGEGGPRGERAMAGGERRGGEGGQRGERAGGAEGGRRGERGGRESHDHDHDHDHGPVSLAGLDAGLASAKAAVPGWQTIQVGMPRGETAQVTVSESHRGRPDLRRTLTVDLAAASVVKNEGFESQSTGRKVRGFVRWIHTGEAFGWVGQTVAGLAAFSAVVLVWTGFALSWRRFFKRRRANATGTVELKEAA